MLFFYHFTVLTFFYRYMFQQLWFYWLKDGIPSSSGVADTYKTTSLFIFVSSHALFYQRNPRLPYTCSCSPSLPCSVVPHFRPVPFRILDLSSVPFRSVPLRSVKQPPPTQTWWVIVKGYCLLPECSAGYLELRRLKLKHTWQLTACLLQIINGSLPTGSTISIMMVVKRQDGKGHA